MVLEEGAEAVTLFRRVSLFQGGVSEQGCPVTIAGDDWLVAKKIRRIFLVGRLAEISQVRVGVVANEMPGIIPGAKESLAFRPVHAHSTNKEGSLEFSSSKRSENAFVCLLP